jgi:hypothetical protein
VFSNCMKLLLLFHGARRVQAYLWRKKNHLWQA